MEEGGELEIPREELAKVLHKQEARMRHLVSSWEKSEVMLMLFHDEASGHAALCVERKHGAVRWYEPGTQRDEGLRTQVNGLRALLLPGAQGTQMPGWQP